MGEEPARRRRGRPAGGGAVAEELRETFLDTAERLFVTRGYRNTTIETIARSAGYSRGSVYRHFPTRDSLVEALMRRTTQRHMVGILYRLPADAEPLDIMVESLVIVATELNQDPLVRSISDQADDRIVANMLANHAELHRMVEAWMATVVESDAGGSLRPGLRSKDLARFLIATSMSLLLGVVPGSEDPETTRRYIEVFFLPAVSARFPPARPVFTDDE